jgi:hypothetical protein
MKARLVYWHKAKLQARYILEMKIYEVRRSAHYRDGVRYRMILMDPSTGRRVLMDNHYPKGPHLHLDSLEIPYDYTDEGQLVDDFKRWALRHMEIKL